MLPCGLDIHAKVFQHTAGNTVALAKQTKEDMFRSDVSVIERPRFLGRKRQDFLYARRVRDVADHFLIGPGPDLVLDFQPHAFEIQSHFPEHSNRGALSKLYQPEQEVFSPDEV